MKAMMHVTPEKHIHTHRKKKKSVHLELKSNQNYAKNAEYQSLLLGATFAIVSSGL